MRSKEGRSNATCSLIRKIRPTFVDDDVGPIPLGGESMSIASGTINARPEMAATLPGISRSDDVSRDADSGGRGNEKTKERPNRNMCPIRTAGLL